MPVLPSLPPTAASPVPLFNPREIQLEKKDAAPREEANSSSDQRENPFRKAANSKDQ